ncbi:OLC1v1016203C4 [Oldenlandia corymbosa var. corymbosa]|uniref:OLC1v1016203C4 n=1 Tax=Oldenlandia corymbosa var. corymbosa TaxID=529605 RepID=A0AAV1E4Y9_OLDCO|nr:OLC1v1016203C4 [Oldenlandia corymbosa var. corymbosa]
MGMPAESEVSSNGNVCDNDNDNLSASGAVKLVSSDCKGNGVIIQGGDGDGGGGGEDHSGTGKQGVNFSSDDTNPNLNVFVPSNDDSSIPVPVSEPSDGNDDNGDSNEGLSEDVPNGKHTATEVDHGSPSKSDVDGDYDSVDTLNRDSLNKADDVESDSFPGAATKVILDNGSVSGEMDFKSSAASELDDQETEVAPLALESVTEGVDPNEPGQEELPGPDVDVNGANSLVLDSATVLLDNGTESLHVNREPQEDAILVSSICSKSSEGVVDSEPSAAASVEDHQDSEVAAGFSLESVVVKVDSHEPDLAATESGDVLHEPEDDVSVLISSESVEVDDFSQSASTKQQIDDAHGNLPAGTVMFLQNGTVEDSAVHHVIDPEPSPAPEHYNQKPEDAAADLESDVHSVVLLDTTRSADEPQEEISVMFTNKCLEADASQSAITIQQNAGTDDRTAGTQVILQNGEAEESVVCKLVHHEIGSEASPPPGHDGQESEVPASLLESDVDIVHSHKPELAVDKLQEDNILPISSKSSEADVSQSTTAEHNLKSFNNELVGPQESDATCSDPQQAEVQLDTELVTLAEQAKPEVLDQLQSSPVDISETSTELPSGPQQHQQTFDAIVESVPSGLDKENEAEQSKYEVDLTSSTETTIGTVPSHTEDHLSVPPSSGGSQDVNEMNELDESSASGYGLSSSPISRDDKVQHEINVDAARYPDIEVPDEISVKLPEIAREHETALEAVISAESNVINTDEVTESATDLGSEISKIPEGGISCPATDERSADIVTSKDVSDEKFVHSMHACSADITTPITEFELGITDSRGKVSIHHVDDASDAPKVVILHEPTATHSVPSHAEGRPAVDEMNSATMDSEDCALACKPEVSDNSIAADENTPNSILKIKDGEQEGHQLPESDIQNDDKLIGQESESVEKSHSDETSMRLLDSSTGDALAGQDASVGLLTRPFQFLIKIPRFDDSNIREQIKHAQLQVDEKTKIRDDFRQEIQKLKENCYDYSAEREAAWSDARSSKRSLKAKRVEIDSLQVVINKVKNAISVEDIDARIYHMEHMIQHETLPLKEEKQYIREIKLLKQHREQLSSSIGNQDEVQQALNERGEIEERLKILRKELEHLKDEVFKKDAIARAAEKKFENENTKFKELRAQFEQANDTRQLAWQHLQSLRKDLYDKNKLFRTYKDNAAAASDFAATRDTEALHRLCHNQVETIMDLWNKDDEFRKEYVKCNVRSTVRRLGTLDGRSLGPDEEPPVLPSFEWLDRSVSKPTNTVSVVETPLPKQVNQTKPVKNVLAAEHKKVTEGEEKNQTSKNTEVVRQTQTLGNGTGPTVLQVRERNDEISEKEYIPTKEELELARKEEELRKKESEAKLREQRRVEEKLKALEAVERKKRIAEKAQMRAELRAQKEAEQKEKVMFSLPIMYVIRGEGFLLAAGSRIRNFLFQFPRDKINMFKL